MPEIKFTHVVSCNSEEKQHPAENLLRPQSYKKWKCKAGEKQAVVILQLEKSAQFQSLDIGNEGSAFIEIIGGRSSTSDDEFEVVLPTAAFMTPDECRKETNLNGVRFFDSEKLTKEGRDGKWDRIKIICTQPFNKNLPYGLSFVKVHAPAEKTDEESGGKVLTFGKFKLKDDLNEDGLSKTTLAPGALFLARKKAGNIDEVASALASTAEFSGGSRKKEPVSKQPTKRKSTESTKADANDEKKSKKIKASESPKKPVESKKPTPKTPDSATKKATSKTPSIKYVPFSSLFDGVVFVLSGFQNPLRSDLRDQATEMGAKYRADWGPDCTHLVCAFANTPKYNQVKGKGKIIKKEWISDSHKKRRNLDWRKYTFEKVKDDLLDDEELVADDGKPKKPDVPVEKEPNSNKNKSISTSAEKKPHGTATKPKNGTDSDPYTASTDYANSSSGGDTDDEIKRVRATQKKKLDQNASTSSATSTKPRQRSPRKTSSEDMPALPEFFKDMRFFFYGGFPDAERKQLSRYIVAFDGAVESYMGSKVTHVLTHENWDDSFDEALGEFPKITFLKPEFVLACGRDDKMANMSDYRLKKR